MRPGQSSGPGRAHPIPSLTNVDLVSLSEEEIGEVMASPIDVQEPFAAITTVTQSGVGASDTTDSHAILLYFSERSSVAAVSR